MAIRSDPENNEIRALFDLTDFTGKHIMEIGCGNGRMTWRYADVVAHVTAIDPFEKAIQRAKEDLPNKLRNRVEFHHSAFKDFATATESAVFDMVILSWTL